MTATDPLRPALRGLAAGRIALGIASLAAPRALARVLGVSPTSELSYLTRIFGIRAIALGLGYLTAPDTEQPRWQRLALMVDITDTTHGVGHLVRRDLPLRASVPMVALTGSYATIGTSKLARDLTG